MADAEKNPFEDDKEIDELLSQLPEPMQVVQKKLMELMIKK